MNDFHSDCKRQLVTAAGALFGAPAARPDRRMGGPRYVPLLAAVLLGALLLAAAAFAATQIIGVGSPVTASPAPGRERPSVSTGIGIPVAGAKRAPASAQLLALSAQDPGGGLPWGMRIVHTTRGLVCMQIGRLLHGRLGVLGQDGEFNDDGLFHELPVAVLDPDTCIQPTDRVLLNDAGVPAAGTLQSPTTSCLAPWERTKPSGPKPCPASDERLVAFGVLGPHAVSVSYRVHGQLHTAATGGGLGAYLVVLRPPPDPAHNIPVLGGVSGPLGGFPIGAGRRDVVSRIMFRFGGHLCQTGFDRQANGPPQCRSSIARTGVLLPKIPHGLDVPVVLKAYRTSGGYDLRVTFTAPVAVHNASTAYGIEVRRPSGSGCGRGGIWGQSIERDVARGQTVHVTEFVGQPHGCHGVVHGRVILGAQPHSDFFGLESLRTIGRFSFALR